MIEFDRVEFGYENRPVFRGLSLRVKPGERAAIAGASGRGKTTLLRLVMGLEKPAAGRVSVAAERISPLFQDNRLLPFLTLRQNCAMFCADDGRIAPVLDALGLSEAADALPSALSGGMARRAALARMLCHPAELYLLDEPFTGLDAENAGRAARLVNKITAGKTLLAVTHHPEEAALLACGRVIEL